MAQTAVTLDDKYTLESGRVFLTGTQALVRLPMMQRRRDDAAGLNTGCFISGYRGSPLGALDQQLWRARTFLQKHNIHFQPGVNEDLACTALWGTQQVNLFPGSKVDGIFGMIYAKGPGIDRSGDALRHANLAGTDPNGGVLVLAGDDHTSKSSTTAHQTEYAFMDAMIPVLNPSGVQEFLDMGLYGWAMSRYSGCWVAFKVVAETVDSSASVYVDPHRIQLAMPEDFEMPPGGLGIRWPDGWLDQEERLHRYKLYAALAFARANKLDKTVIDSPKRRFGIVTCGKSYLDVRQALDDLGIDDAYAAEIGLSVYKVGMTWPLERDGMRRFARGLEEILVIEEKRAVIENQLKEQLYNWDADVRPIVNGKFDEKRNRILPSNGELTPAQIARVIAERMRRFHTSPRIEQRVAFLEEQERALASKDPGIARTPYFCSGCPHNTSTRVPEGSRAVAGIGCHYMAQWMDRNTDTYTHMGAEGVPWVGQAPFTETKHIFANLGDGTYFHSGILAIRMAVASKVNMTYKILFNDAVAMTGGQPHDGPLTVPMITHQLRGEAVGRIVVVTDEPEKYGAHSDLASGVDVYHRRQLDAVQRELREMPGVTILIYDQTCAAEKRRRRKRGLYPDPAKRAFINEAVCEGCGDCSVKSNCLSVVPVETEFGRKRMIDQSTCNKDYSCVEGFCPSFVTVHGGDLKRGAPASENPADEGKSAPDLFEALPDPALPTLDGVYGILVTGVGGTGVVTIGALLGMAAHIEGKGVSVLDMIGLAQKGGAVVTHVRIADTPEDIHAVRLATGGARVILGCDNVVAAARDSLSKVEPGETVAAVNTHETITGDFTRNPDYVFPGKQVCATIEETVGKARTHFVEATELATALLGDSIATNLFMLGYAYQKGLVPVSDASILQAIELNGVAVDMNRRAFTWGRRAAHDLAAVRRIALPDGAPAKAPADPAAPLLNMIQTRIDYLTQYQNARYAARYAAFVDKVRTAQATRTPREEGLTEAVAHYYFKLLAYKDEYEVARLHADPAFMARLKETFEGDFTLRFHLAPPLFAKRDPVSGELQKREYGGWMLSVFRILTKFKGLRGTPLDPFGYMQERKDERALIKSYEAMVDEVLQSLTPENHALAVEIACLPEHIRGYGHVKQRAMAGVSERTAQLLDAFRNPKTAHTVSAAE
jgi:indolepyruvate ferredoxin oxidoreductase